MSSAEIRQAFLDFFAAHGHQVVPSSSLVPVEDPSLLFTNAGMVQFKDVFLGTEQRSYKKATSVQCCLRAGGKHNDLENVGFTARHHTFFEMLGNFSFGDYFKPQAIKLAWTFLTDTLAIPKEKLWVTVFEDDLESEQIWLDEMHVPPARVIRCGAKDNFWAMGDTGPCGPCTEIYYDHGEHIAGGPPGSAEMDGDRFVEIWNVVFMQFSRDKSGTLHPLPKPAVDTGMGLERIAAVMQGVNSNYDTDIFVFLKQEIAKLGDISDLNAASVHVIADHIRACIFLLAYGVMPSNEGRGYVLRRIIRRAIRHGNKIGLPTPFMSKLVKSLIVVMGEAYPALTAKQQFIEQQLRQEEQQFAKTLHQGMKLLQESMQACGNGILPGEVIFKLYDTYGFPVDLTADAAREANIALDMDAFQTCMQAQREKSQANTQFHTDYLEMPESVTATNFQGYEHLELRGVVTSVLVAGKAEAKLGLGEAGVLILSDTPFYAESGGQIADSGSIVSEHGEFVVTDTQKHGEIILHHGFVSRGEMRQADSITATVDEQKRQAIRLNHTATHILHAALRALLGESALQKGSLVNAGKSRFDFAFNRALTVDELETIEDWVNDRIRANTAVATAIVSLQEAQQNGAIALFGEKYSEEVRVLSIGNFSQELCGGTHVQRTGEIGLFKLVSEASIASGVRRIEFVTGKSALEFMQGQNRLLIDTANKLKTSVENITDKLAQNLLNMQQLQQKLQSCEKKLMLSQARDWVHVNHHKFMIKQVRDYEVKDLRNLNDLLRDLRPDWMFILYIVQEGHLHVVVSVPKALQPMVAGAAHWVKLLCTKGGGRDDFAQGGGIAPQDLAQKIQKMEDKLLELTST